MGGPDDPEASSKHADSARPRTKPSCRGACSPLWPLGAGAALPSGLPHAARSSSSCPTPAPPRASQGAGTPRGVLHRWSAPSAAAPRSPCRYAGAAGASGRSRTASRWGMRSDGWCWCPRWPLPAALAPPVLCLQRLLKREESLWFSRQCPAAAEGEDNSR